MQGNNWFFVSLLFWWRHYQQCWKLGSFLGLLPKTCNTAAALAICAPFLRNGDLFSINSGSWLFPFSFIIFIPQPLVVIARYVLLSTWLFSITETLQCFWLPTRRPPFPMKKGGKGRVEQNIQLIMGMITVIELAWSLFRISPVVESTVYTVALNLLHLPFKMA